MIKIDQCPESLDEARVIAVALPRKPVCSLIDGRETPIVAYAMATYGDYVDGECVPYPDTLEEAKEFVKRYKNKEMKR
jgi:hypothetical protein